MVYGFAPRGRIPSRPAAPLLEQSMGFRVGGLGFRVWGLGFGV